MDVIKLMVMLVGITLIIVLGVVVLTGIQDNQDTGTLEYNVTNSSVGMMTAFSDIQPALVWFVIGIIFIIFLLIAIKQIRV